MALTTQSFPYDYAAVKFKYDLCDVLVLIDTAIPCGLILNELISNAIKYAFPEGRTGEVQIGLRQPAENEVEIWVSDNGVGLPEGFDCRKAGKLGMKTIFMIGEGQLQGKVEFEAG